MSGKGTAIMTVAVLITLVVFSTLTGYGIPVHQVDDRPHIPWPWTNDGAGGNITVNVNTNGEIPGTTNNGGSQPTNTGGTSNDNPPVQQSSSTNMVASVTVSANDPVGAVIKLPGPGNYTIAVSGAYSTGTHDRSVVAVLVGGYDVTPCGDYNEPCANFWVGSFDSTDARQKTEYIDANSILVVAVDDLGSYGDNSGSVTVTVTGN